MAYDLERFVLAQEGTYEQAREEVRRGRKTGHWMWWVFPQIVGLGSSATSRLYAIADLDQAVAYLAHPVLGPRLREMAGVALEAAPGRSAVDIFGPVDAMKLRSCMTLFARADPSETVFRAVLDRYYGGKEDPATVARL
ncbi:MAG TPA: DUF1810 domain-containing protein [Acidimicrobiales bacterium]|nr:DUF1810 domain-containing protein [Acidimicrobiales bacterium]